MQIYISYSANDLRKYIASLALEETVDENILRQEYQKSRSYESILTNWMLDNRGKMVLTELGEGIFSMPSDVVDAQLKDVVQRYMVSSATRLWVGIGKTIRESQIALEWVEKKKQEPSYFEPSMIEELKTPDDEPVDWERVEGSSRPPLEQDMEIMDMPLNKADDSSPMPEDDSEESPKSDEQMNSDQKEQQGEQEVDPNQLIQEVMQGVQENLHEISVLKQSSPKVYETIVDLLRVAKAFNLMLDGGQEEEQGGGGEGASTSGGGEEGGEDTSSFPVGTVHKGRVKIQLPDGSTKWVSVKSGQQAGGISAKATSDYSGGNNNYGGMINADDDDTGDEL